MSIDYKKGFSKDSKKEDFYMFGGYVVSKDDCLIVSASNELFFES